jgi:glyoxylate reductase
MIKPRVFVTRVIAQEALDKIAQVTEMEVWPEELPPPYEVLLEKGMGYEPRITVTTG